MAIEKRLGWLPPALWLGRAQRPIDELRRALYRVRWHKAGARARFRLLAHVILWPAYAVKQVVSCVRKQGAQVHREYGVGRWRQLAHQLRLGVWWGVPPEAYYEYGLFDPALRKEAPAYLANSHLYKALDQLHPTPHAPLFTDKTVFPTMCAQHGLPTIPILAACRDGKMVEQAGDAAEKLTGRDVFAKPADSNRGRGVMMWRWSGENQYEGSDGSVTDLEGVLSQVCEASRVQPYIVQPRLSNHEAVPGPREGGLCTARVLTGRTVDGELVLLDAVFKMVTRDGLADNFAAGGIACGIDLEHGVLGTAAGKGCLIRRYERHPDTGEAIEGATLPCWAQVKDLCCRAHDTLSDAFLVAWDVALTAEGPLLVEPNATPCLVLLQKGAGRPVGNSLGVFLLSHLNAAAVRTRKPS